MGIGWTKWVLDQMGIGREMGIGPDEYWTRYWLVDQIAIGSGGFIDQMDIRPNGFRWNEFVRNGNKPYNCCCHPYLLADLNQIWSYPDGWLQWIFWGTSSQRLTAYSYLLSRESGSPVALYTSSFSIGWNPCPCWASVISDYLWYDLQRLHCKDLHCCGVLVIKDLHKKHPLAFQ